MTLQRRELLRLVKLDDFEVAYVAAVDDEAHEGTDGLLSVEACCSGVYVEQVQTMVGYDLGDV